MNENRKSFLREISIALFGALFGTLTSIFILKLTSINEFHIITINEIPSLISKIYYNAPTPLRLAYYAWFTLLILYGYSLKYDKLYCNYPRRIKSKNFKELSIFLLAALAVVNHLTIKEPQINRFPIYYEYSQIFILIGYFVLALGFYIIYSARPAINGYWGPHLYEYNNNEHNKLIDHGLYKSIRHPIYLGQIFMSIGTFILSNNWVIILFPIYMIIINMDRAEKEEKHLESIFGTKYIQYKDQVNKWFPNLFR